MATARRTDGSQRVRMPNSTRAASPPARRPLSRNRLRKGPSRARTKATFWPGHDEQVRQARGPEVVGDLRALVAVVAQDEPGEQGPVAGRQDAGTPQQGAAEAVGQAAGDVAGRRQRRPGDGHPGRDVAAGQALAGVGRHGRQQPAQLHSLAGEPVAQRPGRRPPRPRLDPLAADAHVGPQGAGRVGGVADQGGDARPLAERRRAEAGPRPGPEGGGGQRHRQHEQHRPAQAQGDGDQRQHRQQRERPGGPRAGARGEGQGDGGPVAHQTFTSGRSASSLVGPMPGTSSSSVTERNRPWLDR